MTLTTQAREWIRRYAGQQTIDFGGVAVAMSVDKVLDIAKTIITIDVRTDGVRGVSKRTLFLTEEQKAIKQLFEMDTTKGD